MKIIYKLFTRKESYLTLSIIILFIVAFLTSYIYIKALTIALAIALLIVLFKINYEQIRKSVNNNRIEIINSYINSEAFISISSQIENNQALPLTTNKWIAYPDFINEIFNIINKRNPEYIVECGSGNSTILICSLLNSYNLKSGKLYTLEHDLNYYNKIKDEIESRKLGKKASIIYSPLKEFDIDEEKWVWYDFKQLNIPRIDLLIIDGPPDPIQKNARYPALPLLYKYFTNNTIVIIDDLNRDSEKETFRKWENRYGEKFSFEKINTIKGAGLIKKD